MMWRFAPIVRMGEGRLEKAVCRIRTEHILSLLTFQTDLPIRQYCHGRRAPQLWDPRNVLGHPLQQGR
jgi:hypothetical protein